MARFKVILFQEFCRTSRASCGALSGLRQFLPPESPLKMMKKAFYFTSEAFFVLKIFKFLISNLMTPQPG